MLYRKGGHNRDRNCRIPRISPLRFVLRLRLQKRGAYLRDTTVHVKMFQATFTSTNDNSGAVCSMTESPKTIIHLVQCIWLPYLAANSLWRQSCRFKGIFFPSLPCISRQVQFNKTRPFNISNLLHSTQPRNFTQLGTITQLWKFTHSSGNSHSPHTCTLSRRLIQTCSMYLVQQWFPAPSPLLYTSNYFLTLMNVKMRVFRSGRSSYANFHSTSEP